MRSTARTRSSVPTSRAASARPRWWPTPSAPTTPEEPFNSTFAYLVAAADALSGGRPGARRQQDENFVERIRDLEHIASQFKGVERVYAVQGGREVRVLVQEGRVTDERAVKLSSEIAQRISDEMVFPGQIKVTVIREVKAVATAS